MRIAPKVIAARLLIAASALFCFAANAQPALSKRGGIDIDGSGKSVLLVRSNSESLSGSSGMQVGRLVANQFQFTTLGDPGPAFRLLGVSDWNGNGKSDLFFQNTTQGTFGDVVAWSDFQQGGATVLRQVKPVWE